MLFQVSPVDNVYFGKGVPFGAGFETVGVSVFPPSPSVLYGAFSTYYLSLNGMNKHNKDFVKANMKIKGLYYSIGDNNLHTLLPMDLVKEKSQLENKAIPLELGEPLVYTDIDGENVKFLYSKYTVEGVNALINEYLMEAYLKGSVENVDYMLFEDTITVEDKIGIKIDNRTNSAQEGYLYKTHYIRMAKDIYNQIHFVVDVECGDYSFPEEGFLKLGGEGKIARVEAIKELPAFFRDDVVEEIKEKVDKTGYFKLVLVTPAFFKDGWKPDLDSLGIKAELVSANIGKPISIGGWDMDKNYPKTMSKAVPAGSVYYYKLLDGTADELIKKVHKNSISYKRQNEGFGIALIGVI